MLRSTQECIDSTEANPASKLIVDRFKNAKFVGRIVSLYMEIMREIFSLQVCLFVNLPSTENKQRIECHEIGNGKMVDLNNIIKVM